MSELKNIAIWMFGDVKKDEGFWYSHHINSISGLNEEQLFWIPNPKILCILWYVGHIAHREKCHISKILQDIKGSFVPQKYEIFGDCWCSVKELRSSIDSVQNVLSWADEVRKSSRKYILSLNEKDFYKIPKSSELSNELELSIGHWLFITSAHTSLHIGRIQLLRAMIEDKYERAC